MTSDVVLSSALRTNLLSLQNTQSNIDKVQNALATGLKVNSALDNPQSFFAAQSLNNRAGDLGRLLDGIGQSISTIQAADKGITSLSKLIDQADSVAQQAQDALSSSQTEAKVTGTEDLRGLDSLTDLTSIVTGDQFDITTTDSDGASITETIVINTGDSIEGIAAEITDQFANTRDGEIEATVNAQGQLEITSTTGRAFRIEGLQLGGNGAAATDAENLSALQDLGLSQFFAVEENSGNTQVAATILPGDALVSTAFFDSANNAIADASTLVTALEDSDGTALFADINNAADDLTISVNDGTASTIDLFGGAAGAGAASIQNIVDQINSDTALNELIEASYNTETGEFSIRALSADVSTIEVGVVGNDGNTQANLGFGGTNLSPIGTTQNEISRSYAVGTAAGALASLENDYNSILEQIDQLVGDSDYRGTNLINGDELTTFFNEDRSSSLTVEGKTFTSTGLGLSEADFARSVSVTQSLNEIRAAKDEVRSFGSTLANNLAVIQTREDFTSDLINELEAGADKLTVADPNEEGAKLLALQTRQQLGVTSLSLASQSQQAVLRLF